MPCRRARPLDRADSAAPEAEEVGEEDDDEMSSLATCPASPAPSISRLISSALCPGSAARTSSRQPAASHQKATSRRNTISRNEADDCSDGETVGDDGAEGAEEEGGTPAASISRSLRRITRAVSHTISGAPPVAMMCRIALQFRCSPPQKRG